MIQVARHGTRCTSKIRSNAICHDADGAGGVEASSDLRTSVRIPQSRWRLGEERLAAFEKRGEGLNG